MLSLIVIAYMAFGHWPAAGSTRSYDVQAWLFVATYVMVAVFAVLFFEPGLLGRVMWRAATVALWIGVISCVLSRVTGHLLLSDADQGIRMQGTLSEPSAWAPVLTLVLLFALRRRSWIHVALALAGLVLTASPTCMLVMAITVPLYCALASTWRHRLLLLAALAVAVPAAAFWVLHASPQGWLDSGNAGKVAVGRLLSGVRNVETDGQQGSNDRYANTAVVIADARTQGPLGAGPAADTVFFPATYPAASGTQYDPVALWSSILFDYGMLGVAVLAALMLAAVWQMRRTPVMTGILLPFFVASLVNSAEGTFGYAFVALGIMLFVCGWAPAAWAAGPLTALPASE